MQALWLDFERIAPDAQRWGIALLAVSTLLSAALIINHMQNLGESEELRHELTVLKRAQAHPATAADPDNPTAHSAAQWQSLFATLEAASNESVTLLSVTPGEREIQILGEAKNLAASMDYVQRLQASNGLGNAHLTQTEQVADHPLKPVRFTLGAQWPGAAQ